MLTKTIPQQINKRRSRAVQLPGPHLTTTDQVSTIVTYTVPWANDSLMAFLRRAANAPRMYWANNKVSLGLAGCGITARLTAQGDNRFQTIQQAADQLFQNLVVLKSDTPAGVGLRLFGGFSFRSDHNPTKLWSAFPAACFILPRYQLACLEGQLWLTINHHLEPGDVLSDVEHLLDEEQHHLRQIADSSHENPAVVNSEPPEVKELMDPTIWHWLVTNATQHIQRGGLDKVVLARARQMRFARPIDPADILTRLEQNYPDCYRFLFEPIPGHAFYGATPELLAEVTDCTLSTVALAGSIRRGQSPQEDEVLGQQLLDTPKERQEHAYVVDAIEESLEPLVSELRVAPQPGLCRLSNIQHIQTPITGDLAQNCDSLTVVEALHPTPALGGRPKQKALPLIYQSEPVSRGWYGSPIGWLDHHNNGMFAVAIRSAVSVGHEAQLFAGAGIVADSKPDKEWHETQLKFKPLMEALSGATKL